MTTITKSKRKDLGKKHTKDIKIFLKKKKRQKKKKGQRNISKFK